MTTTTNPGQKTAPIVHELKTEQEYYRAVVNGVKTFEARKDDKTPPFEVGHYLRLKELRSNGFELTGFSHTVKITYVIRGERFGIKEGFAVLGITPAVIPTH